MNRLTRAGWLLMIVILFWVACGSAATAETTAPGSPPVIRARSAILLEQGSGQVLYSKAADERTYPASLTKMLTALVVVQYGGSLDQTIVVGNELWKVKPNSSTAGLLQGDRISLRNLLYAMLLPSGNDAAYVAAVHTARTHAGNPALPVSQALQSFAALMNQTAKTLGATRSNFVNPDGYHDDRHYTTASDLALIADHMLRQDVLRQAVAQAYVTVEYTSRGRRVSRSYVNTNRLINPDDPLYYPQATGLKTGTTTMAGPCLASAASADRLDLIAIVLGSDQTGRWSDSRALLDYGFAQYQHLELTQAGQRQQSALLAGRFPGIYAEVGLFSQQAAGVVIARNDVNRVQSNLVWDQTLLGGTREPVMIRSTVPPGTVVAQMEFILDQQQLATVPVIVGEIERGYRPSTTLVLIVTSLAVTGASIWLLLRRRMLS